MSRTVEETVAEISVQYLNRLLYSAFSAVEVIYCAVFLQDLTRTFKRCPPVIMILTVIHAFILQCYYRDHV